MKEICAVVSAIALLVQLNATADESDRPLSPLQAARTMKVPNGFRVTLFAGEPDVKQPIGFCIDDRGRLWVAEAYNYPNHKGTAHDRIIILEDTDNDGRFDKRKVFYDKLNYVTGIEAGFGGAWVMSPPNFFFIPDRDRDDRPDAEPQVLLDGFGNHANAHNLANGFAWGPDGWLYGTHGRTNWSMIGKPGTPNDKRVRFDGGVYRYHPVRHVWEPFADGTTNPWGIDFDDYGEGFVCNCVNPHLFHVIQGAHYEPWRNRKSSQYAYERIDTIADHLHFIGGSNIRGGIGSQEELDAGGGHAHCGTMVYLGDNWPDRYRNTVFMNNIHGRRMNNDILRRKGSGYTASHGRDLMLANDPWFMGVTIAFGPDGGVFVSDWSDTGECHSVRNTRRHTGRIFKIVYGKPRSAQSDVAELSNDQLVKLQTHRNDWYVRHARRLLQERTANGQDMTATHTKLKSMYESETDIPRRLRALWALHTSGGLDDQFLVEQLDDKSQYIRSWAIRLMCEDKSPPAGALGRFAKLATSGTSSYVRLQLASALQRLRPSQRWDIAAALVAREEDESDQNLPLMIWYGIEPLVDENVFRFVDLAAKSKIPLIRRHIARRASTGAESALRLGPLVQLLGESDAPELQRDLLTGMALGLQGRRSVAMPKGWPTVFSQLQQSEAPSVAGKSLELALVFDDPSALRTLRELAADTAKSSQARNRALEVLIAKRDDDLPPLLLKLVDESATQSVAIRGLAEFDHPATSDKLLQNYPRFDANARQDVLQTLAARRPWALAMLDAIETGKIRRNDLTAYTVRQLQSLGSKRVVEKLKSVWGDVRETPAEKARLIATYKRRLNSNALKSANLAAGRAVFQKKLRHLP